MYRLVTYLENKLTFDFQLSFLIVLISLFIINSAKVSVRN